VTAPYLVEKAISRNDALCVLDHEPQEFAFQWREGNHAAFSSQLDVAEIHIHVIKSEGVPRSPLYARIDAPPRGRALTTLCR